MEHRLIEQTFAVMGLTGFAVGLGLFHRGWGEFFAFMVFQLWFTWNAYAYPRNLPMVKFPMWAAKVSRNGNSEDRRLLFMASVALSVIFDLGWVHSYFSGGRDLSTF